MATGKLPSPKQRVELMSCPLLLLVDDAPEIGIIVERLGKRAGQEVICCADALVGWDYLEQTIASGGAASTRMPRPDLVILDLNLPGVSGVELCRRIRATPELETLPVALFSH